jgi:hypothetical protein
MMEQTAATIHVGVNGSAAASSATAIVVPRSHVLPAKGCDTDTTTPGAGTARFCPFGLFYLVTSTRSFQLGPGI